MTEKRDPPFKLDMPFGEALGRFIQTDPHEILTNPPKPTRRRPVSRDGEPFTFTLLPAEVEQITSTDWVGSGGMQSLSQRLKEQLATDNIVLFNNAELGQLIRYMSKYGAGTFQTRLRKAFIRSIYELLAFEGEF